MKKKVFVVLCVLLALAFPLQLVGCANQATPNASSAETEESIVESIPSSGKLKQLTANLSSKSVEGKKPDDAFVQAQMSFAVELLKNAKPGEGKNQLISPLSAMLALSMTANGAGGQTKTEMEAVLGGGMTVEQLNAYLHNYLQTLTDGEEKQFRFADSIWFFDGSAVEQPFLQACKDYYDADVFQTQDGQSMLDGVNGWVNEHTDGMIPELLKEVDPDIFMYLINAIVFDAGWKEAYEESDVQDGIFTNEDGTETTVNMMHSDEEILYKDADAIGFAKPYAGDRYRFVALLPNEGVSLDDYIASLTAEKLQALLANGQYADVIATMPKFKQECTYSLNEPLQTMGMQDAFIPGSADFHHIADRDDLFIGSVVQKTFIEVSETGTKAAAVTGVGVATSCLPTYTYIDLNRPFLYMIVDSQTNLPLFIGTVAELLEENI